MDNYWVAKRLLFGWVGLKSAVVNVDDDAGALLVDELARGPLDLWSYSTRADAGARLVAEDVGYRDGGLAFTLVAGLDALRHPRACLSPLMVVLNKRKIQMPKMKTKSGAKKRFSRTATGLIKANVAHKRHRLISKPQKMKRKARGTTLLAKGDTTLVLWYMPYLRG